MSYLEWKPEYSVGVAAIDAEHQEMIELINTTYEKLKCGDSSEHIEQFLGEIFAGISAHFALEERMMEKARNAEYLAHKQDHEDLLDQIRDLMDIQESQVQGATDHLQEQLGQWFAGHFATFDARLHQQLG